MLSHVFHLMLAANPYAIQSNGIAPAGSKSLGGGIGSIIKLLMGLLGGLSVIFVIVGGLQITLAAGNPARFKQGRETIIYAAVGVAIAIAGFAIVTYLSTSLK